MSRFKQYPLSIFISLLAAYPAYAQDSEEISIEDISFLLDFSLQELIDIPLVTASRKVEARDQTPAHVMVVTRKQIRERRYIRVLY
ncbi:MAG: hypothetical protein WAO12_00765 [Venatoribacter sp.]